MECKRMFLVVMAAVMLLLLSASVFAYELDKVQVLCNEDGTFSTRNIYKENVYPRSSKGVCFEITATEWVEIGLHPDFSNKARANKNSKKIFIDHSVVTKKNKGLKDSSQINEVGYAEIAAGDLSTRVLFEVEFDKVPIVTATPIGLYNFNYGVDDIMTTGFDVLISQAQEEDIIFNWHAFGEIKKGEQVPEVVVPIELPVEDPIVIPVNQTIVENETIPDLVVPDPVLNETIPINETTPVNETVTENETIPDLIVPIEPFVENETAMENETISEETVNETDGDNLLTLTGGVISNFESQKIDLGALWSTIISFFNRV
ncbi:hypothetical protein ACFLZZ_02675 [Nanoarchaeota archaeon]